MSPTLEGRFLIAGPPGKSNHWFVWTNLTEGYLGHLYSFYLGFQPAAQMSLIPGSARSP